MIKGNLITMVTPVVVMTFVDDKVLATWRQWRPQWWWGQQTRRRNSEMLPEHFNMDDRIGKQTKDNLLEKKKTHLIGEHVKERWKPGVELVKRLQRWTFIEKTDKTQFGLSCYIITKAFQNILLCWHNWIWFMSHYLHFFVNKPWLSLSDSLCGELVLRSCLSQSTGVCWWNG